MPFSIDRRKSGRSHNGDRRTTQRRAWDRRKEDVIEKLKSRWSERAFWFVLTLFAFNNHIDLTIIFDKLGHLFK